MKKLLTIWMGELISNIGSGMTAFAITGIVMLGIAFIFGRRRSIKEMERKTDELVYS